MFSLFFEQRRLQAGIQMKKGRLALGAAAFHFMILGEA